MFGILEYQDVNKWSAYAIDFQPTKNITIFGFLHLVYTKYPDKFPELVGEVLRRYFVNNIGNLLKYKEQAKQFLDIIIQTFERYLMILEYDMQLNIHILVMHFRKVFLQKVGFLADRRPCSSQNASDPSGCLWGGHK